MEKYRGIVIGKFIYRKNSDHLPRYAAMVREEIKIDHMFLYGWTVEETRQKIKLYQETDDENLKDKITFGNSQTLMRDLYRIEV